VSRASWSIEKILFATPTKSGLRTPKSGARASRGGRNQKVVSIVNTKACLLEIVPLLEQHHAMESGGDCINIQTAKDVEGPTECADPLCPPYFMYRAVSKPALMKHSGNGRYPLASLETRRRDRHLSPRSFTSNPYTKVVL